MSVRIIAIHEPLIAFTRVAIAALGLLVAPAAFAAPPDAPIVTVGAGLKQIRFDWNYVPRAGHYEVWFRSNPGAAWAKFADVSNRRTRANVNISAHLLHWLEARYVIKACNPSGCASSSEISVAHLMRDSVGYFKTGSSLADGPVGVGANVAMSEDGNTIAAGSSLRINGSVVVFHKSTTGWAQEAVLLPSVLDQERGGSASSSMAMSGDGAVIALGIPEEVRRDTDPGEYANIGAVYLFRRTSSGWVEEQRLASEDSFPDDAFGRFVSLDASGTILAVSRRWGEGEGGHSRQGPVELFRHTSAGWLPLATLPVVNDRCYSIGLSGDGGTLVRSCDRHVEVFAAPGWNRVAQLPVAMDGMSSDNGLGPWPYGRAIAVSHDGSSFAARSITLDVDTYTYRASVAIFRETGAGWARETTLASGDWLAPGDVDYSPGNFGAALSLSRDGRFLAIGSSGDPAIGSGVVYPPISAGNTNYNGAVYVYERRPSGWRLRQFIKPNFSGYGYQGFGAGVSLARNGKDLAVGAPGDASNARGIDGDQQDISEPGRGAVWVY
jgi:hypothetical protein